MDAILNALPYVIGFSLFIYIFFQQKDIKDLEELDKVKRDNYRNDLNDLYEQKAKLYIDIEEANKLYNCAYHINKYWDKILREIYSRYGERARLAPIEYEGMCDGIHKFSIKVNVPGKAPTAKQWKLGEPEEWNFAETVYYQESFTLLIPEVATEQEERFGKALCEMEVKFD